MNSGELGSPKVRKSESQEVGELGSPRVRELGSRKCEKTVNFKQDEA